ncbi:MAG: hypothetical protein U9N81_09580 [Bacillota bacterium]|nr:hypothetical protein [Bacillota bacterium]
MNSGIKNAKAVKNLFHRDGNKIMYLPGSTRNRDEVLRMRKQRKLEREIRGMLKRIATEEKRAGQNQS